MHSVRHRLLALGVVAIASWTLVCAPPALAGPRNDLLVDFGANGLWVRLNNSTWQKLDAQSPEAVAACTFVPELGKDWVVASFVGRGLLIRRTNEGFFDFRDEVPAVLVPADFDGNGRCDLAALVKGVPNAHTDTILINQNGNVWFEGGSTGTTENPGYEDGTLAAANLDGTPNDDLVVRSHYLGFQIAYNDYFGWSEVDNFFALKVIAADLDNSGEDELIYLALAQGPRPLIVAYNPGAPSPGPKVTVRNGNVQAMAVGDLDPDPRDDLVVGDGGGVYVLYNNTLPFVKLDNRATTSLAILDLNNDGTNDIVAGFGSSGVWKRVAPASTFTLLRAWPAESLTPCACD